ncbi:hypothetical protein BGX23_005513, partial [Mortierella sp. AD031]
ASTANDITIKIVATSQGDRDAQLSLGRMYREGDGVEQDYQAANHWYLQAAKNDDISAQVIVDDLYRLGQHDTALDHSKVMEWYLKAADSKDPSAQNKI